MKITNFTLSYVYNLKYVIVGKTDYFDKMESSLNEVLKSGIINIKNDGILSFAVNQENRIENILQILDVAISISEETRRSVNSVGTRPHIMY